MVELSDDELLAELGVSVEQKAARTYTPQQERIIAGFEDILKFHDEHGRAPQHGEQRDIFERLYAVRLDRLRELADCRSLLAGLDKHGLLEANTDASHIVPDALDDDALLAELGIDPGGDVRLHPRLVLVLAQVHLQTVVQGVDAGAHRIIGHAHIRVLLLGCGRGQRSNEHKGGQGSVHGGARSGGEDAQPGEPRRQ